jgi:hypothetical protein
MLKAHIAGATEAQLAQTFDLTMETVKKKIPVLELARINLGIPRGNSSAGSSSVPDTGAASSSGSFGATPATQSNSGMVAGPVPSVIPPSTYTVPAGTPGGIVPLVQGAAGKPAEKEQEEEETPETPPWMKDDGRETVNTIEMAIRGVNSKETFSPVTILLPSFIVILRAQYK